MLSAVSVGVVVLTGGVAFAEPTGQLCKLPLSDDATGSSYGTSVAISGTTAIVGNPYNTEGFGVAAVYDTTTGQQVFPLVPDDGVVGNAFGVSVAVSGTTAVVGALGATPPGGAAYIFDTATGLQVAKLVPEDATAGMQFGMSVAISGNTVIVGAFGTANDNFATRAAYLFDATTGGQLYKLTPDSGEPRDSFGFSVAISGTRAIVGAQGDSSQGSAYVFDTTTGNKLRKLYPDSSVLHVGFGQSVAINKNGMAIVGAAFGDAEYNFFDVAYLFDSASGQRTATLFPKDVNPLGGVRVAISDATAIVGEPNDPNGEILGFVYLYDIASGRLINELNPSFDGPLLFFGESVAISNEGVVVGALGYNEDYSQNSLAYYSCPPPQIVDLNDGIFRSDVGDSIQITTDKEVLAIGGRTVEGLAADGVTPILLRWYGDPGGATEATQEFEVTLKDDNGSIDPVHVGELCSATLSIQECGNPLRVPIEDVESGNVAFAIIKSPIDFVRSPDDLLCAKRMLTVEARLVSDDLPESPHLANDLTLVRPPVVLMHGIWSSSRAWGLPLQYGGPFDPYVMVADYERWHAIRHIPLTHVARAAAETVLNWRRKSSFDAMPIPIAATQVDVVGHSMGGIIWRKYLAEMGTTSKRADNLRKGDVHKLILLDSPQRGSPWAKIASGVFSIPLVGDVLGGILERNGMCMTCGGVEDMRASRMAGLPGVAVPTHAIYGTGASDFIDQGQFPNPGNISNCLGIEPQDKATFWIGFVQSWVANIPFTDVLGAIFSGERHDIMVSEGSQKAGLTGPCTSHFSGLDGFHTYNNMSCAVGDRIEQLLNAKTVSDSFCNPLPTNPGDLVDPGSLPLPEFGDVFECQDMNGIDICAINLDVSATPLRGPGNGPIEVTVAGSKDFAPTRVLVFSTYDIQADNEAPFEFSLYIPDQAYGPMTIQAIAFDVDNNLAESTESEIFLGSVVHIAAICSLDQDISLFAYAPEASVRVMATLNDGTSHNLIPGFPGLTFSVADPTIATVDVDSVVTGQRIGSTVVTVSQTGTNKASTVTTTVDIEVLSAKDDFNSDGAIDLEDFFALSSCVGGPGVEEPSAALLGCQDFFDHDEDLDVDLMDFAVFQGKFGSP